MKWTTKCWNRLAVLYLIVIAPLCFGWQEELLESNIETSLVNPVLMENYQIENKQGVVWAGKAPVVFDSNKSKYETPDNDFITLIFDTSRTSSPLNIGWRRATGAGFLALLLKNDPSQHCFGLSDKHRQYCGVSPRSHCRAGSLELPFAWCGAACNHRREKSAGRDGLPVHLLVPPKKAVYQY